MKLLKRLLGLACCPNQRPVVFLEDLKPTCDVVLVLASGWWMYNLSALDAKSYVVSWKPALDGLTRPSGQLCLGHMKGSARSNRARKGHQGLF